MSPLAASARSAPPDATATHAAVAAAIETACGRIAPLWPLQHFVAVNPFLGFAGQHFGSACATLRRVANADMLMPRSFHLAQIESGHVTETDLASAFTDGALPFDIDALKARLRAPPPTARPRAVVATVAEVLDRLAHGDRELSRTAFMIDEISKWCAAYFDEGQAAWQMPWRDQSPFTAWRLATRFDRNPEMGGIGGFRATIAGLPDDPVEAIATIVAQLGIPERALPDYLHRALLDIQGWAAYARYRAWNCALRGQRDTTPVELLAIRVAWGYALFRHRGDREFAAAWRAAMAAAAGLPASPAAAPDDELALDLALQRAYETAVRRRLFARFAQRATPAPAAHGRPAVHAAFCIDVRSEVFRRALETVAPDIATLGFAGFFGFPIEYVPIGQARGGAQCPVLLVPTVTVCEHVEGATAEHEAEVLRLRLARRRAAKAWKAFKQSAVSSFTFVETLGLGYAAKIASDTFGLSRPVPDPDRDGLDAAAAARIGPRLERRTVNGRVTGFDAQQRVAMAEAALRGMSLTEGFAPLVLIVGHGSTTVNNPHASGLDCGACGGHTGEANARVAAAILNDPSVRSGLAARGIAIPADTCFLGALHDTTTDEVTVYSTESVPATHSHEVERLQAQLAQAGVRARAERAALLGVPRDATTDRHVLARSRDWSQVRPEWGLAGNAAFIAAPRARTRGIDLAGRCFLHEYDWQRDRDFAALELIMTAPLVVASWINLQYYGSTVNNRMFGSGNKTLHNVVGALGVLEGNAGDLRTGLPLQSVHDGRRFVHEPVRLGALIDAPATAIEAVIGKHARIRELVDNEWLHLYRFTADDGIFERYRPPGALPGGGAAASPREPLWERYCP